MVVLGTITCEIYSLVCYDPARPFLTETIMRKHRRRLLLDRQSPKWFFDMESIHLSPLLVL